MSQKVLGLFFKGVEQLVQRVNSFAKLSPLNSNYTAVKAYLEIYNFLYTEYLYWYNGVITTAYRQQQTANLETIVFYDNLFRLLEEEKKRALATKKNEGKKTKKEIQNSFETAVLEMESTGKNLIDEIHRNLKDALLKILPTLKQYQISYHRTDTPFVVKIIQNNIVQHTFNFHDPTIVDVDEAIRNHPWHQFPSASSASSFLSEEQRKENKRAKRSMNQQDGNKIPSNYL